MVNLDNSNKRLLEGLVILLRSKVDGWSTNSEHNVNNVWSKDPPVSAEDEFPRGVVDIISGNDFDLSVELDAKLREVTVKVVAFAETSGEVEELIDLSEDAVGDHWDSSASEVSEWDTYTGDWSFRETDGFTELVEEDGEEGHLRYNRSIDMIFETVKQSE